METARNDNNNNNNDYYNNNVGLTTPRVGGGVPATFETPGFFDSFLVRLLAMAY